MVYLDNFNILFIQLGVYIFCCKYYGIRVAVIFLHTSRPLRTWTWGHKVPRNTALSGGSSSSSSNLFAWKQPIQ